MQEPSPVPEVVETPRERRKREAEEKKEAKRIEKEAQKKEQAEAREAKQLKEKARKIELKLSRAMSQLRKSIAHPMILDAPGPVVDPVRSFIRAFEQALEVACDIKNGVVRQWDSLLDSVPFKQATDAEKILLQVLLQLNRAAAARQQ